MSTDADGNVSSPTRPLITVNDENALTDNTAPFHVTELITVGAMIFNSVLVLRLPFNASSIPVMLAEHTRYGSPTRTGWSVTRPQKLRSESLASPGMTGAKKVVTVSESES